MADSSDGTSVLTDQQRKLLEFLKTADGGRAQRATVKAALGVEAPAKYYDIATPLRERGLIGSVTGPRGHVFITQAGDDELVRLAQAPETAPQKSPRRPEQELYSPVRKFIEATFAEPYSRYLVAESANLGSKDTGGKWSRPDIILVGRKVLPLLKKVEIDVFTFEIKKAGAFDLEAVYETVAHSRRATSSYLLVEKAEDGSDKDRLQRIEDESERLGIGLYWIVNANDVDAGYELRVVPRREPSSLEDIEQLLSQNLHADQQRALLGW